MPSALEAALGASLAAGAAALLLLRRRDARQRLERAAMTAPEFAASNLGATLAPITGSGVDDGRPDDGVHGGSSSSASVQGGGNTRGGSHASSPLALADAFAAHGYVVIRGFLSPPEVAAARCAIDDLVRSKVATGAIPADRVYCDRKGDLSTLKQVQGVADYSPWVASLYHGRCQWLASAVFGAPARPTGNVQFFNKTPQLSKATPAHQDGYYFHIKPNKAVTMWIALDDADARNGCVFYVKGSADRGMRPHEPSGVLGFSQRCSDYGTQEDVDNEIEMRAAPGDLVCHSSLMLHRAGANVTGSGPDDPPRSRRALGTIFYRADVEVDHAKEAAYQAKLRAALAEQGKI